MTKIQENKHTQQFESEDVQQILTLAMRQTDLSSRAQIEEIAKELSIETDAIERAIETWRSQKLKAKKQQQQRQQFYCYELFPYLAVNTFLICLNISISGALTWAIYPLMGWGVALLVSLLSSYFGGPSMSPLTWPLTGPLIGPCAGSSTKPFTGHTVFSAQTKRSHRQAKVSR